MYIDGFVLAVPKKNMKVYRRLALIASKVWKKHGALQYVECTGDDLNVSFGLPFPKLLKLKKGETAVFSWILYKSSAHRVRVNTKAMKDPMLQKAMSKKIPFDVKRMSPGGFKVLVKA